MRGEARKIPAEGKFSANLEGPFKIKENLHNGAYHLQKLDDREMPRIWNASHLKMYFSLYVLQVYSLLLLIFFSKRGFG